MSAETQGSSSHLLDLHDKWNRAQEVDHDLVVQENALLNVTGL